MTTSGHGGERPLTPAEEAVVRALDAACRHLGLDDGLPTAVLEGIRVELRARVPGTASGAAEVPEREWAEIGAAAAVGVLFASGVPGTRRRPRRNPASAGFEPLELARLSSRAIASLYLRRWVRARRDRRREDRAEPGASA